MCVACSADQDRRTLAFGDTSLDVEIAVLTDVLGDLVDARLS
ncbi:MAG: hypothetical protein ACJAR2_001995 [Ilumatobacter sp.]|jgi:hypothetical protein